MRHTIVTVATGSVLGEDQEITLRQLCRACGVSVEVVSSMVEEGILEPAGARPTRWRFPPESLRRVRAVVRLQRDLELNLAGAALAIDLLDHVERLRARVRELEARR
jgi:chaperone modulatory protein CbpM